MSKKYLKSVFWDYPHLCDPEGIEKALNEAKLQNKTIHWIMARFLERGRFNDTALFFGQRKLKKA